MIDCVLVGYNDIDFADQVQMVRSMGAEKGAFKDLNLAFVEHGGRPYRSMDLLNHFYLADKPAPTQPFSNADFLWPVITYLGTYLARHGCRFEYVNLFHREKERLREVLAEHDVLAVAITTTLYVTPQPVLEIVDFVRRQGSRAKIVVGGPYIGSQVENRDEEALQRLFTALDADVYIISHEGERTLVELLGALKTGRGYESVPNLAYRRDDRYIFTPAIREANPLEENMVDYALFPSSAYGRFVTLRTAKSCPFSCAFCRFPIRAGKYLYLTVEDVERELDMIRDIGTVDTLTFIDDTFNVPRTRFKDLLRMMIKNRYGFKWNCFYRSDHGDAETIALMGEAGCEGVFLGIESGSDPMLKRMNKTARRKHYQEALPLLRAAGILTYASLIVGFPGETPESIRETIDFIEEARPDFYRAQLWFCDPTTPIWQQRDDYRLRGTGFNWVHATMTAPEAAAWIDHMFLTVENSVWLPQHGFEMWSVYYLQRHGMDLAQVKTFLRCFNAAVAEQLLAPAKTAIDPRLLAALAASARFDRPRPCDMTEVSRYAPHHLRNAAAYWTARFADGAASGALDPPPGRRGDGEATTTATLDGRLLEEIELASGLRRADVLLAAFALLQWRLGDREHEQLDLLVALNEGGDTALVPVRLSRDGRRPFSDLASHLGEMVRGGLQFRQSALFVLADSLQAQIHGCSPPRFAAGFAFGATSAGATASLHEALASYPHLREGIGVLLEVAPDRDGVGLRLRHAADLDREFAGEMLELLVEVVKEVRANPHQSVERLLVGAPPKASMDGGGFDRDPLFNFP